MSAGTRRSSRRERALLRSGEPLPGHLLDVSGEVIFSEQPG